MVVYAETCVGLFWLYKLFEKCFKDQIKFILNILDLFMFQYCSLVLFGVEKSSHGICMHSYIFVCIYFVCDFGAIILCVNFRANNDCDCEDCCYSPNYQGKWCFMILFLCFSTMH